MKQKLAIARALLHRPSLVFLDEPTAGLDPEATVALRRDIVSLGTTVFLTTHNLADVEKMATHVAVIRRGQLLDFGTPAELRARAMRTRVTIRMQDREPLSLELAADESVAPVVTKLVHEGARIEEVRREEATIEDVFLHLVKREAVGFNPSKNEPGGLKPAAPQVQRNFHFRDIATVIRKEWREMMAGSTRASVIAGVALLAILAAFAAYIGEKLIASPAMVSVTMIGFVILLGSVADSFAGERERHTLETLLASAIPDEALLLGKIGASVAYGWLATLALLVVVLAGVNVTHGALYPASTLLGVLLLSPLMLGFFSITGVLLSLRAATVREAQTRLSVLFFGLFFGLFFPFMAIRRFMPRAWREQSTQMMFTESGRIQAIATLIAFVAILDLALLALAFVRFRRSRLI
jgi:ABC-2 type transport system permease protein